MKRTILLIILIVLAVALGVGGAYAVSQALPAPQFERRTVVKGVVPDDALSPVPSEEDGEDQDANPFPGMDPRGFGCGGMIPRGDGFWSEDPFWGMNPWQEDENMSGERLTLDQALEKAQSYLAERDSNLRVARLYEFQYAFIAVTVDSESGDAAYPLLIQPVSGQVRAMTALCIAARVDRDPPQGSDQAPTGVSLSMSEAAARAQQALDARAAGMTIDPQGIAFPGYYTFEYSEDGDIAGLISVHAETGVYRLHNGPGDFIRKEEISQ